MPQSRGSSYIEPVGFVKMWMSKSSSLVAWETEKDNPRKIESMQMRKKYKEELWNSLVVQRIESLLNLSKRSLRFPLMWIREKCWIMVWSVE